MIIIAGSSNPALASKIAKRIGIPVVAANTTRFADGELRILIKTEVRGVDVAIVQSISRPAEKHLLELLLLIDAATRAGARRVIAVLPYIGYARQDRVSEGNEPISAHLIAKLIEAAGANVVITVDIHSTRSATFFTVPLMNLDGSALFATLFKDLKPVTIVAPDFGSANRVQQLARKLNAPLSLIHKVRPLADTGSSKMVLSGIKGRHCVIYDDIIDSGFTLAQTSQILIEQGALSIHACATHAVLSGQHVPMLSNGTLLRLYITNTIAHGHLPGHICVLSAERLIARALEMYR